MRLGWPRNPDSFLRRGKDTQTMTGRQTELLPRKELSGAPLMAGQPAGQEARAG